MPTYLDIHDMPDVRAGDLVGAHAAGVRLQDQNGVQYRHYWLDEQAGKVLCLVDAPNREAAMQVHREATASKLTPCTSRTGRVKPDLQRATARAVHIPIRKETTGARNEKP